MDKQGFLDAIAAEHDRATAKFPTFNGAHEGYAVLLEEVDELWQEVKHGKNPDDLEAEAVQVGAMALRFLLDVCNGSVHGNADE